MVENGLKHEGLGTHLNDQGTSQYNLTPRPTVIESFNHGNMDRYHEEDDGTLGQFEVHTDRPYHGNEYVLFTTSSGNPRIRIERETHHGHLPQRGDMIKWNYVPGHARDHVHDCILASNDSLPFNSGYEVRPNHNGAIGQLLSVVGGSSTVIADGSMNRRQQEDGNEWCESHFDFGFTTNDEVEFKLFGFDGTEIMATGPVVNTDHQIGHAGWRANNTSREGIDAMDWLRREQNYEVSTR